MYQIIYASSACQKFSKPELEELLTVSRRNNERRDVTGMLLYKDGNFLQVLEGPQKDVTELYQRIIADPRHRGTIALLKGETQSRDFPDWTMGFRDLDSAELLAMPGYNQFLNYPLDPQSLASETSRARKLLATFKRTM